MELDKYDSVVIKQVPGEATPVYSVLQPKLTPKEQELIGDKKIVSPQELLTIRREPDVAARWEHLKKLVESKLPKTPNTDYLAKMIAGSALGYGELSILVDDDNLEEIMVNGINVPVYVFHRKYGMCKTNITYLTGEALADQIFKICFVNKKELKPILDISTLDGIRVNITADPLPSKGSTITIRKQRRSTFSIIELIQAGTISVELAAFLWLAVEGMKLTPANIIIAGSIGSGKTTTLNALCNFIPPGERAVTIEDTLELNLEMLENKVQLEAKEDYDMDALLRDSLRMRPDRIIVGEIRGKEAITLFNAMSIGRVGMGTLHASSAKEATTRLENPPMSVAPNVIASLDIIVVQNKFVYNGQLVRRVTEVVEVTGAIKDTIMMSQIFEWDPRNDRIVRKSEHELSNPILFLDKLAEATKLDKGKIIKELELRESVLAYMIRKGIQDPKSVSEFIRRFYLDLSGLIQDTPDLFSVARKTKA